ncbi:MAG: hypothetical protein JW893_07935 [Candidatus Omnitrophica bacterium]|nr:hypothetical protein [Candidatus Omnitrophota bacterium]
MAVSSYYYTAGTEFDIIGGAWPTATDLTGTAGISFQNTVLELRRLNDKIDDVQQEILELKDMIQEILNESADNDEQIIDVKEIDHVTAKAEIAAYFQNHHGQTITAADIQQDLGIDIFMAIDICEELEKENRICGV